MDQIVMIERVIPRCLECSQKVSNCFTAVSESESESKKLN